MKMIETSRDGTATLQLSRAELETLSNALNEVCNGLDLHEFSIRLGADKPEVLKLLHRFSEVLDLLGR